MKNEINTPKEIVVKFFEEGGMVATRILYDGVHTGTCMGIPATGKISLSRLWKTSKLKMEKS